MSIRLSRQRLRWHEMPEETRVHPCGMIFCLSAIAVMVITLSTAGSAATIHAGSDIQRSIDSASPGDTIIVGPGVYEKFTVNKRLNLIGNDATVLASSSDACISVEADMVNISGFIVRNGLYGIRLSMVRGCSIRNNTVTGCKQPGIVLLKSSGNTIANNNASYNGVVGEGWYGIYLTDSSNDNLIVNNIASNNGAYGIHLSTSCSNNTIRGNTLNGNMYGVYMFTGCSNNIIEENLISGNRANGIDLRFNCNHNMIRNNTITDNQVAGISLLDSGDNGILNNDIRSNIRFGIQIQGKSDGNTVVGNNITQSPTGIFVESNGNIFHSNRLIDNVIQAVDRGENTWNAPYPVGGNAWSDYNGVDERSGPAQDVPGADGFGDTPREISNRSRDMYPVTGYEFKPIRMLNSSVPGEIEAGEELLIKAWIESVNGLSQVSARIPESRSYVRLYQAGDHYEGSLTTALLDPGEYSVVITATDRRGYELEEVIGKFRITPRAGRSFEAAMAQLRGRS